MFAVRLFAVPGRCKCEMELCEQNKLTDGSPLTLTVLKSADSVKQLFDAPYKKVKVRAKAKMGQKLTGEPL
jgi:hypothetical protein